MAKKRAHVEELQIDLTPMIDVVFQLIIFFMCIMKFKTLEKKIAAYLPKDVGLAPTPVDVPPKLKIQVRIKQKKSEGVPRFYLLNQEMMPGHGLGVPPLEPLADDASSEKHLAYQRDYETRWQQYIKPKLDALKAEIDRARKNDDEAPGEIRADADVRHAYVIGALDCFLVAGLTDVTFYGTDDTKLDN